MYSLDPIILIDCRNYAIAGFVLLHLHLKTENLAFKKEQFGIFVFAFNLKYIFIWIIKIMLKSRIAPFSVNLRVIYCPNTTLLFGNYFTILSWFRLEVKVKLALGKLKV